ncbi:MAG: bifunctional riboflavin kinase/FAD synthetase [Opitutaceae bacterium]|nr:bifunctional riboflavin kinase/FAD synthetase [Cytophagales bacterium]
MKVYHSFEGFPKLDKPVVTIGNFDGVHLGHKHVLESLVSHGVDGFESVVITFWPHPRRILNPESANFKFLTSITEKIELLQEIGIGHLIILPFDLQMGEMTAHEFVQKILIEGVRARKVILGYDHRFGKDRAGGLDFLQKHNNRYNLILEEIPKKEVDNIGISSSKIKSFLIEGKISEANLLLGRNYSITGKVVEGKKLGRTIGFPTANIQLEFEEKLLPGIGVYAVRIFHNGKQFKGMMNIGYRPTVLGINLSLEVHIFDFSEDIYGKFISIEFIEFIRAESKFPSLEELKLQLKTDKISALNFLN